MGPDVLLDWLKDMAADVIRTGDAGLAVQMAYGFNKLDRWLRSGGCAPGAWRQAAADAAAAGKEAR